MRALRNAVKSNFGAALAYLLGKKKSMKQHKGFYHLLGAAVLSIQPLFTECADSSTGSVLVPVLCTNNDDDDPGL
ncbi:hypothetical protein BDW75DRAFT_205290 [Aspergillus navahoensis]